MTGLSEHCDCLQTVISSCELAPSCRLLEAFWDLYACTRFRTYVQISADPCKSAFLYPGVEIT